MKIVEIIIGRKFKVYDVNDWYRKFYKELDEEWIEAVDSYLDSLADGKISYRPKCFSVEKVGERICELKPKGVKNQVRLFVYKEKSFLYILGGLVKKTNIGKREKKFYEIVARRQKELRRYLDG